MEFVTGFLVGVLGSWWTVGVLLVWILFLEDETYPVSIGILTAILIVSVVLLFNISLPQSMWIAVGAGYYSFGVGWAIWRYYRYLKTQMVKMGDFRKSDRWFNYDSYVNRLKPINQKARIFGWIFAWPFSIIQIFTRDIVEYVYEAVSGVFTRIYNSVLKDYPKPIEQDSVLSPDR